MSTSVPTMEFVANCVPIWGNFVNSIFKKHIGKKISSVRGGYECSCRQGYELSQIDNATCQVNSKLRPAVLFFAAKTMVI